MNSHLDVPVAALPARRESGCPVHFLWDGRGAGRWPVRLSFWLMSGLGMVVTGAAALHVVLPPNAVAVAVGILGALYAVGQVASFASRRRVSSTF